MARLFLRKSSPRKSSPLLRVLASAWICSIFAHSVARADQSATELTIKALRPLVKVTSVSSFAFNYSDRSTLPINTTAEKDFEMDATEAFCDLANEAPGADAPGLYLAIDPVISRTFGGKDWVLRRYELPAGMRYLDLKAIDTQPMPPELARALAVEGCRDVEQADKLEKLIRRNDSLSCRRVAVKALAALKLDAIAYSWSVADFSFCRGREDHAWIILNPKVLASRKTRIFSKKGPISAADQAEARIYSLLFMAAMDSRNSGQTVSAIRREYSDTFSSDPADKASASLWAKHHLLGCGF